MQLPSHNSIRIVAVNVLAVLLLLILFFHNEEMGDVMGRCLGAIGSLWIFLNFFHYLKAFVLWAIEQFGS